MQSCIKRGWIDYGWSMSYMFKCTHSNVYLGAAAVTSSKVRPNLPYTVRGTNLTKNYTHVFDPLPNNGLMVALRGLNVRVCYLYCDMLHIHRHWLFLVKNWALSMYYEDVIIGILTAFYKESRHSHVHHYAHLIRLSQIKL